MAIPEGAPPPPFDDTVTFQALIASLLEKQWSKENPFKFVKCMEEIPLVVMLLVFCCLTLAYFDHALVGKFTGMCPSPKSMESYTEKNLKDKMKGKLSVFIVGNGTFSFLFGIKEDKEVVFINGPYFFGNRGMHLNRWSLDFDPTEDIPSIVPLWVNLPYLPLSCWNDDCL